MDETKDDILGKDIFHPKISLKREKSPDALAEDG